MCTTATTTTLLISVTISVLLTFITSPPVVTATTDDVQLVRGVELKLQPFYNPHKQFMCLDGSGTVPFSSVNDDYCDCADGTDEPGTAACPHSQYYCYNIGYMDMYIPSSRVNDGICDCCDGSDEYDSDVVCFNECQQMGAAAQEEKNKDNAERMEGARIRSEYVETGRVARAEKLQRVETINSLLEERRKQLEVVKTLKEEAEKPEKEAKDKHHKEWEDVKAVRATERDSVERGSAFEVLDVDHDGWVSFAELISHNHLNEDLTEDDAKKLLGGETMVDREGMVNVWKNVKEKYVKEGRVNPSNFDESNINQEEEEVGGETPPPPIQEPPAATEHTDVKDEEEEEEQMPEYDESLKHLIALADKARSDFDSTEKHVRELEKEKKELDDYLKLDMGKEDEFSALKGKCFELTDREYVYKLCPFDKVTQKNKDGGHSETNLGNRMSWVQEGSEENQYTVMKYSDGAKCWNGPSRSTVVKLSCGRDNMLTSTSEPSRCEYEMHFKTPALCHQLSEHDEL